MLFIKYNSILFAKEVHMDQFIVYGGTSLKGSIEVDTAKNAVLPIIAASILTDDEVDYIINTINNYDL